ncbi:MAG TPA: ankyrin repeat domain-containing protein [Pyrinomonadaceae bacterium]|nr:ankyrin repeat domain-containing protein [Pyrinomonadaceae bacterium]
MSARDSVPQIRIASPCDVEWDSMIGNDRVRFCEHCQLTVHNVDRASRKQIKRLVARSKGRLCVNYRQPVPQKLPTPILYKIGRRTSVIAASAFSATLSISTAVAAGAHPKPAGLPHDVAFATRLNEYVSANGSGKLFGFVFDPNGAVVTGASVTLTNAETNEVQYSYTSGTGEYRFEGVRPGTYHLKINPQKGFAESDVPNLVIRANDNNRIDQTLSIAPVEAEVTVVEKLVSLGGAMAIVLPSNPLVKAVTEDDLEAVQLALLSTPNVNVRDNATSYSALERAVSNGNREILQVLLWAKADVNARDSDGQTPLMMIGEDTTSEMIWDLINAGAKINLRDHGGDTALISAAEIDNVEALKVLLDAGAKVNETNNDGETALIAAAQNDLVHNVRALILAGADVNARDKEGKSALMYALDDNHKAVVRLLKAHGAIEFEALEKQ